MDILLVEDEPQLSSILGRALKRSGHMISTVESGFSAIEALAEKHFDLVVLDADLPGSGCFDVLDRVRQAGLPIRILMLAAELEIGGRVAGLETGALDSLAKPFAVEELMARVEALGRRSLVPPPASAGPVLRVGPLCMDIAKRRVLRGDERIELSPREFEVLQVFMSEPGRTFSRDELCERVWAREHEYDTRTVEIFIMRLRKKLDRSRAESVIGTVRGVGYHMRVPAGD